MGKRGPKPASLDTPKYCPQCNTYKARTEEFWNRNSSTWDGLGSPCRECRSRLRKKEPVPKIPQFTKVCPKCKLEKPLTPEFFWRHRGESSGYQAYCKTCAYTPTGGKGGKKNPYASEGMKVCPQCSLKKPLTEEFWARSKATSDGFQGWCKPCNQIASNNKKQENRLTVLIHYSQDPPSCSCCRESNLTFLCIDHIAGGGNQHRKELLQSKGIASVDFPKWLINQGFPEGYRILCHNCNWAFAYLGYCPHHPPTLNN